MAENEIDFSVYYMGLTEPDRNWDVSKFCINYDYWVDHSGKFLDIGWYKGHLNPKLVWRILREKQIKNIVLAVSWTDPNIMFIAFLKLLHLTNKRLFFWAEANYTAAWANKHNYRFKMWLKRRVFNTVDGALIIPGKMSEITFEKWEISVKRFIYLPNTIDDSNLLYEPYIRESGELPVFIMPIRVIESVKGGLNFFSAIGENNVRRARFIIAGAGEDEDKYAKYIEDNKLHYNIIMEGFCDTNKMSKLYSKANAFVLPSFSDPSPLSLVEALFFHLPILCSNHCGNHYEAVDVGENGLVFSPLDQADIKNKFESFMKMRDKWIEMGNKSGDLYDKVFNTKKVVGKFVSEFSAIMK